MNLAPSGKNEAIILVIETRIIAKKSRIRQFEEWMEGI
jgi:hypothetical protein